MQLIIDKRQKSSNFTGLSLVLFLFLSMLSMMAAYEAGKQTDDPRGATIVSLNEYSPLGADSESDAHTLLVAAQRLQAPAFTQVRYVSKTPLLRLALAQRAFNARAPPAQTALAS
jgi:hypothetical protein